MSRKLVVEANTIKWDLIAPEVKEPKMSKMRKITWLSQKTINSLAAKE